MNSSSPFDAIVVGAGLAGASAACAMSDLGYRVLVVDASLDHSRRLAGELIHPLGVLNLGVLGLFEPLVRAGGVPVRGFAVLSSHERSSSTPPPSDTESTSSAELLDYPDTRGLVVERGALMNALLGALAERSNVELWTAARVTGLELQGSEHATVIIKRRDGECTLKTRLLVGADGRSSFVRKSAGITTRESRISLMLGYHIAASSLPFPAYGHVFVGGPGPLLAYTLGRDRARMMVDVPSLPASRLTHQTFAAYACALPPRFARDAQDAIAMQTPLVAPTYRMTTDTWTKGCVALVGDAAGCCHPLTASGMNFSTRDALWLQHGLRETAGDIPTALERYSALRAASQRTRFLLADLLYNMFAVRTPGMHLLCSGTMRYWRSSPRGRRITMSLLASHETRLHIAAQEIFNSVRYALPVLWSWPANPSSLAERRRALIGLVCDSLRHLRSAGRP